MNHLSILGNLTRDPELRFTSGGLAYARSTIAYNFTRQGEKRVTFLPFTIFGKSAEPFQKYHAKGSRALLEGRIEQEDWVDKKTGEKRSQIVMVVDRWHFASSKNAAPQGAPADGWADPLPPSNSGNDDFLQDEHVPF